MKSLSSSFLFLCLLLYFASLARSQTFFDVESGVVFTGYNDVRIPGDLGTPYSLKDDLEPESKLFYRNRAGYTINSRHTFSLLYAPLEIKSNGNIGNDVIFEDVLFPANTPLQGIYKFNSYRLTYRYDIINKARVVFGFGFTGKIRDARISLSLPDLFAEKTNVGFVPIINFRLAWKIDDNFGLLLEGDALAAPQGRAEDVLIAATFKPSDNVGIRAGYRILEGGADNDEVYNFALFHYASVGVSYTIKNKTKPNE